MERGAEDFRAFVVGQSGGLLRTAWMLTGDRDLAEDLLQTALARTWPHWRRVAEGGAPVAYVRTVMVRTYASWRGRRWCGETPTDALPDREIVSPGTAEVDDADLLVRALAQLPRQQRATVVLRYYQDLPEQDVAHALNCSVGSVKTHASRGLARLRLLLDDQPKVTDR